MLHVSLTVFASLHRHYPASIHPLGLQASAVLFVVPTPLPSTVRPRSRLEWTYSQRRHWNWRRCKNGKGLIGCHVNVMCSAKGPTTPGLQTSQAMCARSDIAFHVYGRLNRDLKLHVFRGRHRSRPSSQLGPFILTTFLCTFRLTTSRHGDKVSPKGTSCLKGSKPIVAGVSFRCK